MARRRQLRDSILLIQKSDFFKSPLRAKFQSLGVLELQVCQPDQLSQLNRTVQANLIVIEAVDGKLRQHIRMAKRYFPSIPVLVVSRKGDLEESVEAIRSGAEDYLKMTDSIQRFERALVRAKKSRHQPVDPVTGLYHSDFLKKVLDSEIEDARSNGRPLAVIFADLDKFKQVNDQYGHSVGTKVLTEIAQVFRRQLRDTDRIFRYGGDEFVAVLSSCDLETAKRVSERIRRALSEGRFLEEEGYKIRVTASIGIAPFPEAGLTRKTLMESADQAMYRAKHKKGNRVEVALISKK